MGVMRSAIVILTLCAFALAQESAAELFYKAFWLEQAEGKATEATELYKRILAEHPEAPETPRVLLGLARIDKAKSTQWIERLRAEYPNSEERKAAEKLVPWKRERFKEDLQAPSAIERKLSQIHHTAQHAGGDLQQADEEFLLELGHQAGAELPLSMTHQELLKRAIDRGFGAADNSAVIKGFG